MLLRCLTEVTNVWRGLALLWQLFTICVLFSPLGLAGHISAMPTALNSVGRVCHLTVDGSFHGCHSFPQIHGARPNLGFSTGGFVLGWGECVASPPGWKATFGVDFIFMWQLMFEDKRATSNTPLTLFLWFHLNQGG